MLDGFVAYRDVRALFVRFRVPAAAAERLVGRAGGAVQRVGWSDASIAISILDCRTGSVGPHRAVRVAIPVVREPLWMRLGIGRRARRARPVELVLFDAFDAESPDVRPDFRIGLDNDIEHVRCDVTSGGERVFSIEARKGSRFDPREHHQLLCDGGRTDRSALRLRGLECVRRGPEACRIRIGPAAAAAFLRALPIGVAIEARWSPVARGAFYPCASARDESPRIEDHPTPNPRLLEG